MLWSRISSISGVVISHEGKTKQTKLKLIYLCFFSGDSTAELNQTKPQ